MVASGVFTKLQFILHFLAAVRLIPFLQPVVDLPDLPFVSGSNEVWLCRNVQDAMTVPMMTGTSNEELVVTVPQAIVLGGCVSTMVAELIPYISRTVDECQSRRRDVVAAILFVEGCVRAIWRDSVSESPCTPLLGIIDLKNPRDERRLVGIEGSSLVSALFRASRVHI